MKSRTDQGKCVPGLPSKGVIYEHCRSRTNISPYLREDHFSESFQILPFPHSVLKKEG